jgi:2C-methyl-D-erythritol 2,4-cyclodiphosphate synthase
MLVLLLCATPASSACSVVNIKAKTHEKVDSLGENRSIACHAVVMLLKQ